MHCRYLLLYLPYTWLICPIDEKVMDQKQLASYSQVHLLIY